MRRETQNVVLVLLGGALLKIGLDGTYLRYVKPSLLPLLLAAAAVVLLLGVVAIVRDLRVAEPAPPADPAGHDPAHHDHAGRSPWLLVLPVLAVLLVAPPALGADSVERSVQPVPLGPVGAFEPLPDGPAPALGLGDFVGRAVWDETGTVTGREVRLTGFVVRPDDGTTRLARLSIACCAADASPVTVRLVADGPLADALAAVPQDGWVEVRGVHVDGSGNPDDEFVPALTVGAITPVPVPELTYES